MRYLTYADRDLLLKTLDALKSEWKGADEQLLSYICDWARTLSPGMGFEHALTRDVTYLSRYLLNAGADEELAEIARGGLLYVLHANEKDPGKLREFGLLDEAFIAGYAVHEIRTRLGEPATYTPPRLTPSEQKRAEDLFLEFMDQPMSSDQEVIAKSRDVQQELENLASCGLFRRMQKNIDFLITVAEDPGRPIEHRRYARAALNYLVCEDDVIPDHPGIVGYLDDNFVVQMAVDLIEPGREPWLDLLDATVGIWPFLNSLIVDDGGGIRPISEYLMINSALSCDGLRGDTNPQTTTLIVPTVGPTPFLLGFVTTLGLIQESGLEEISETSFHPGQMVLVDQSAVAEFTGIRTYNGRKEFGLKQYYKSRGQKLASIRYWPISELRRLLPADSKSEAQGKLIANVSQSEALLSSLEYLYKVTAASRVDGITKRILVVMSVGEAREMANRFHVYSHALRDLVPMGHLSASDEMQPWSKRFGDQAPILIFVSDLDRACELAEEDPAANHLVIVDASGRNAQKAASLRRLQQFRIPTLIVSPESEADGTDVADGDLIRLWEWTENDLSALLWPEQRGKNGEGTLTRYERKLQALVSCTPIVRSVSLPLAESVFQAVRQLRATAKQREEERLAELDDLVTLAYRTMSRLLRSVVPFPSGQSVTQEIGSSIDRMGTIIQSSHYLTESERAAAEEAQQQLSKLFMELQRENPKVTMIADVLRAHPQLSIICPDARIYSDTERVYQSKKARVFADHGDTADADLNGVVIPGWFRKDRMAKLLIPPVATPLILVLYDIEKDWYRSFRRERRKQQQERSTRCRRETVFPGLAGWNKALSEPDLPEAAEGDHQSSLRELEAIQQHVRTTFRQRVYKEAASDGTEEEVSACLTLFEGDAYAFLTDSYRANVVTHLLDWSAEEGDETADVRQASVGHLKPGDALLFYRGSARDVIRSTADRDLPPGRRETASLWRGALLDYVGQEDITSEQLWNRLRDAGCPLQHQTIRNWLSDDYIIGPQAEKRDILIIASVTGNATLAEKREDVLDAIREVRSAHLKASYELAKRVLKHAVTILKEERTGAKVVEIEADVVLVRVVEIDGNSSLVRKSLTNRLLEGDEWHA